MRGQESDHIRFEPGTYYIGDPCYVIKDDDWMAYLESYGEGWGQGQATTFQGHKVWHNGTNFGDGCYPGSDGHSYAVDAGIIGIIPEALIFNKYDHIAELGRIVKFDKPFFVWSDNDSTFHFGDIVIVTDGSYDPPKEEDDDDEEWEEEDEDEEDEE